MNFQDVTYYLCFTDFYDPSFENLKHKSSWIYSISIYVQQLKRCFFIHATWVGNIQKYIFEFQVSTFLCVDKCVFEMSDIN